MGLILEFFWRTATFSPFLRFSAGPVLIGASISLGFQALREFRRADTNVEVYKPATALITSGPYRFTRNPLYICLSLAYIGAALIADSLWVLMLLIPVLIVIHYGVVLREEQYLLKKFGAAYQRYQSSVRRWL
ncbi:MAG: methyltransferase family protein [bacterium]